MNSEATYLLVDGENIDATLGMSVLGRRPDKEERPRWDRILEYTFERWDEGATGLFFLNASSGFMPMNFVQALVAMQYQPIPLAGEGNEKVVDIGIQRTLEAILDQGFGDVILASHDADFAPQLQALIDDGRRVGVMCFREFASQQLTDMAEHGLHIYDLEYDVKAFQVQLPRLEIIPLSEFDPSRYL
ncbi:NYN domain-containing protein [Boudabousia marimammalium]|uniref:Nuclease n=1 Tax=Boudabousia marimammalium TaxID=156892 RepID=A0A1Q5PL86_9ACTO|nr:NYN domain-containing protein [Boudabousia marimammalium]OKL47390.1 nuclease [Boudabousia marimammalium]